MRFLLGLAIGLSISTAYAQLYPGISPNQRDMTTERYWQDQRFHNMLEDQQRQMDSMKQPC